MLKLVYQRKDGKWEARYKKGVNKAGKTLYGVIYGDSQEDVVEKRKAFLGYDPDKEQQTQSMNLLILGCGTHGKDIKEIATSLRIFKKIKFLDDRIQPNGEVIGKCSELVRFRSEFPCAFVAIGDNSIRQKYVKLLKDNNYLIPNIIALNAKVSLNAQIGEGVAIMSQCTINDSFIGDYSIIDVGSIINSEVRIGEFSRVDCGAIVLRGANVPKDSTIKSGEIIRGE